VAALEQKQKLVSLNQQVAARQNQLIETRSSLEQLPTVTAGKIQSLRANSSQPNSALPKSPDAAPTRAGGLQQDGDEPNTLVGGGVTGPPF